MTVKSADKKPEKYVGPDGKPKIRMVSVDKEVVKSEAYDEPQGQAKRIMSPLQKARMDKEKADRDRDGKLKSESKSFKDFREANTPVGQRDKMKIIDRKPHPDGGHIITMQTKAGKTIKRHLKNGKVKDMTEAIDMSKVGTKATIMHPVTRVSKKVDKKDVKKHVDAGWMHMGPKRNRVTKGPFKTKEGYASDAQRKAVWASKNEKGKKESVELDEVATPAMKKASTELNTYAKKSGGIDKADFMKAADMLSTGKAGMAFIKFVNDQDTEVFEKIISVMSKHMGRQTVEKMFKVRVREATNPLQKRADANKKAIDTGFMKLSKSDYEKEKKRLSGEGAVSEISKKTAQSYLDKTKGDDAWSGTRKANNRLKGAIHAVGKLRKKESVDEVLDTPKAMQSYKDKAKYSRDRASGSAAAKILSKGTLGSHKPELDTMRKRHKGMDMADRNAKKKTFDALRGKK